MSIIERALSKLQHAGTAGTAGTTGTAGNDGRPQRRGEPARIAAARTAPPAPIAVVTRERSYADSVDFDIDALERAGMLPPRSVANRMADEFRRAKWPLLATAYGEEGQRVPMGHVIAVTSSLPAEGKTFSCINLACNLAMERDTEVLLVDGDTAKRHISRLFGLQRHRGLLDLLVDSSVDLAGCIVRTSLRGVHVLPAGTVRDDAPELLAGSGMRALTQRLGDEFFGGVVLIDAAPLLATNEAQVMMQAVGQILMIVRANFTPRPAVTEALRLLPKDKPVSCLLNQASQHFSTDYYGGYYSYDKDQDHDAGPGNAR